MRIGENTSKEQLININSSQHRVIIPLYIPHEKDYYKEAFTIFNLCIKSLQKTSNSKLKISVISNGSSNQINEKLMDLYQQEIINELIIERDAIGKLNSILKVLRTCEEKFITISDADILFDNNWEEKVMTVFENFPKAAAVSPIPVFRTQNHYTSNILFDYFFSKKLQFSKVANPEALTLFAKSIGWSRLDEKWKDVILTISAKNNSKAVVGCNHCAVTYRREVFDVIPKQNTNYKLGGNSEGVYLDQPPLFFDGYRLATEDNYAFHMGNTTEQWMYSVFDNLKDQEKQERLVYLKPIKKQLFKNYIKNILFKKVISLKKIRMFFYLRKGLSKAQIKNFI